MRGKYFTHDQEASTVIIWVAFLPVKKIFGFAALFVCMEIGAPLPEPMLRTLTAQAAAAAH